MTSTTLSRTCRILSLAFGLGPWFAGFADETETAPPASAPERSSLEGLELQPGDEPLKKFEPATPPDPKDAAKRSALAHYMAGRVHQDRGRFDEALAAYLAAISEDPDSISPYQTALPILLQRGRNDEARKLALDSAERSAKGFELVRAMASVLARQQNLEGAIELVQAGLNLPASPHQDEQRFDLHRDLGLFYRLMSEFEKAAEQYEIVFNAVRTDELAEETKKRVLGDPGQIFDEFGDVFLKAGKPELALQAFEEASKYRDAKPGLHSYNLATVFRQTGKPEEALRELQGYFDAQLQTRGRAAYVLLEELLVELNLQDELLSRLQAMFEKDGHNESLRFFLADKKLDSGDLEGAEKLYLNGRATPTDPRGVLGMFSISRQNKNYEQLLAIFPKAFQIPRGNEEEMLQKLAPDLRDLSQRFEKEVTSLKEEDGALTALFDQAQTLLEGDEPKLDFMQAYLLGKLAIESSRTDDALKFYRTAISMRNDPPFVLYMELGAHLVDSEHYDDAIVVLSEATKHPSNALQREKWRFLWYLSYAYEFSGETDKALEAIREAQKLQPDFSRLFYQEAWIYAHAKQWDRALELFNQVVQNYSGDRDLVQECRFRISNIYVEQGDMAKGEEVLELVLKEDAKNPQANNDLGYLWADQGKNLEKAEGMIRLALEKEPENPAYLDSMGWVLFKRGKFEDSVQYLEKATAHKNGEDSTIIEHLGDALSELGKEDEAQAAWKRALEIETKKKVQNDKLLKSLRSKLKLDEGDEGDDN